MIAYQPHAICGSFVAVYISFMESCAKHAAAMSGYTRNARRAQIYCLFLTVVLLQLLLCVNDIKRNPGPHPNIEMLLQGLFTQQEVKFQTLFGQQLKVRFQSLENKLCAKMDSAFNAIENQMWILQIRPKQEDQKKTNTTYFRRLRQQAWLLRFLKKHFHNTRRKNRQTGRVFMTWQPKSLEQSADEAYERCVMKVVNILQDAVPNRQWRWSDIVHVHCFGSNTSDNNRNGFSKPQTMIVKFTRWSGKMDILRKGREVLKKKGVTVAGDPTTKQQNVMPEHRERRLHAHYKGNRLVVAGHV